MAVNLALSPGLRDSLPGSTESEVNTGAAGWTVTRTVSERPAAVAVIAATPAPSAVTSPVSLTPATAELLVAQVTVSLRSRLEPSA